MSEQETPVRLRVVTGLERKAGNQDIVVQYAEIELPPGTTIRPLEGTQKLRFVEHGGPSHIAAVPPRPPEK